MKKSIGRQRPAVQRVARMFAQEPPPDFDVPGQRGQAANLSGLLKADRLSCRVRVAVSY